MLNINFVISCFEKKVKLIVFKRTSRFEYNCQYILRLMDIIVRLVGNDGNGLQNSNMILVYSFGNLIGNSYLCTFISFTSNKELVYLRDEQCSIGGPK